MLQKRLWYKAYTIFIFSELLCFKANIKSILSQASDMKQSKYTLQLIASCKESAEDWWWCFEKLCLYGRWKYYSIRKVILEVDVQTKYEPYTIIILFHIILNWNLTWFNGTQLLCDTEDQDYAAQMFNYI